MFVFIHFNDKMFHILHATLFFELQKKGNFLFDT